MNLIQYSINLSHSQAICPASSVNYRAVAELLTLSTRSFSGKRRNSNLAFEEKAVRLVAGSVAVQPKVDRKSFGPGLILCSLGKMEGVVEESQSPESVECQNEGDSTASAAAVHGRGEDRDRPGRA